MNLKEIWQARRRHVLLENTVMLYILQFSKVAIGLLTQGYEMRVLGMELVGTLGAAQYSANLFQIFIDFGFILSATAKISRRRDDKRELSRILTSVVTAKIIFMILSGLALTFLVVPKLVNTGEVLAYSFYLVSVVMASLLPDFMYRGLEMMSAITVRAVSIKLFAAVMIFVLVKGPETFFFVPLCTAMGNFGALAFVYWHLFRKVGVGFCRVKVWDVWNETKESAQFFLSKAAGAINSNLNGILLNQISGSFSAGIYTSADKVITVARSGMSPVADSLYPHMMKHRNFQIIKKAMLFVYPVILAGCAFVFVFAQPILTLWLGPEGKDVVAPLRLMIPVAVFCFPNYVLGYPTLGAMGLAKYANISVGFGTLVYLLGAGAAYFWFGINWVSLCLLSSITEFSILAFRVVVIAANRDRLRQRPETGAIPDGEDE